MVKLNSKCCIWISVLGPTLVLNGGSKRGPSAFSFFIVCFLLDFRFCFLVIQGSMGLKYWFSTLLPGSIFRKTRRSWLIYSFRSKVVSVTVDSIITVIISFHLLLSATKDYKQLIISLSAISWSYQTRRKVKVALMFLVGILCKLRDGFNVGPTILTNQKDGSQANFCSWNIWKKVRVILQIDLLLWQPSSWNICPEIWTGNFLKT